MRDAHVVEGDLVIVDPSQYQHDGDIVLALLGDEHTIKRLRFRGAGDWALEPANDAYPTMVPREEGDHVVGSVVALVRSMGAAPLDDAQLGRGPSTGRE